MTTPVPVVVDSHLRLDLDGLVSPALATEIIDFIIDDLSVENPERKDAERREQYEWWKLPKNLTSFSRISDSKIAMSRGYALRLKQLMREYDLKVKWQDQTFWLPGPRFGVDDFSYRAHQPEAVRQILLNRQGIWKAPTGSGKTVGVLGFIWEVHPSRSIVLVDRINLVDQWIERAMEHYDLPESAIGRIGQGVWSEKQVTIGSIATIVRNMPSTEWFHSWPIMCMDEIHHGNAATYKDLLERFSSRFRFGVSATPSKTGVFQILLNSVGRVFYETTQEELRAAGLLVEPHVEVCNTEFDHPFWGDHRADNEGDCDKPGCKLTKPFHRHKNNYQQVKKALIYDKRRNSFIAEILNQQSGNHVLIVTSETTHIDLMMAAWKEIATEEQWALTYRLTGKDSAKKRVQIQKEFARTGGFMFSTIAGEALDIKQINRVVLSFPTGNDEITEQNIGRGTRKHGDDDVVVFDINDNLVRAFAKQFRGRMKCYYRLNLKIQPRSE